MKGTGWNRKMAAPICICGSAPHMFFVYFSRSNKGDAESIRRQPDLCLALFNCKITKKKSSSSLSRSLQSAHVFQTFFLKGNSYHFTSSAGTKRALENGQIAGQKPYTSSALAWHTSSRLDEFNQRIGRGRVHFCSGDPHYCTWKSQCTACKRILLGMDSIA